MSVRIEKDGPVWTIIHSRYEARNAMDPESATDLFEAIQEGHILCVVPGV